MPEPTIPADPQERARWLTERREKVLALGREEPNFIRQFAQAHMARTDIPLLLDEIARLDGEIKRLKGAFLELADR